MSVSVADPVDLQNPFSASFTITNTGFPLSDVTLSVMLHELVIGPNAPILPSFGDFYNKRGLAITREQWQGHYLSMDEQMTISPGEIFKVAPAVAPNIEYVDLAIVINHKPWLLPFNQERRFRFVTRKQTDGHLYWYSRPVELPSR